MMNRIATLKWLVGLLVLLNVGLLSFTFFNTSNEHDRGMKPPMHDGDDQHIREQFGFSDEQMILFSESKKKHAANSRVLNEKLHQQSSFYYQSTSDKSNTRDSLMSNILDLSKQLYEVNKDHFQELEDICTEEQLPELQNLIKRLMGERRPQRGEHRRPRPNPSD